MSCVISEGRRGDLRNQCFSQRLQYPRMKDVRGRSPDGLRYDTGDEAAETVALDQGPRSFKWNPGEGGCLLTTRLWDPLLPLRQLLSSW